MMLVRCLLMLSLSIVGMGRSSGAEVVLLGDSWAVLSKSQIALQIGVDGFSVADYSVGGSTADQWANNKLGDITTALNANSDAKVVHLFLGGNDLAGDYTNPNIANLINQDVLQIVSHIGSVRPDVEVYHVSYDFLSQSVVSSFGLTPAIANAVFLNIAATHESITLPNYHYLNFYGLMQSEFGINGIPAGDPSLPNPLLPSPESVFVAAGDVHLKQAGYSVFAREAYREYRAVLVPEPSSIVAMLLMFTGLSFGRRERRKFGSSPAVE